MWDKVFTPPCASGTKSPPLLRFALRASILDLVAFVRLSLFKTNRSMDLYSLSCCLLTMITSLRPLSFLGLRISLLFEVPDYGHRCSVQHTAARPRSPDVYLFLFFLSFIGPRSAATDLSLSNPGLIRSLSLIYGSHFFLKPRLTTVTGLHHLS
ncbi:hypothetical protein Hanom_Chr00s000004g01610021 [Helianthus anomalus]